MEKKKTLAATEKQLENTQEKLVNEKLKHEIKEIELRSQFNKMKRCQQQQQALAEQIRASKEQQEMEPSKLNQSPYGRSESLMALYQKEKAKQLYQEQMAIVEQRRAYSKKVAEVEKMHSLDRLAQSRKE
jgi:hypothetical protein